MIENDKWDGKEFEIIQGGSKSWKGKVMVWNRASGSHGRKVHGSSSGDWKKGDTITLRACGERSKYSNIKIDDIVVRNPLTN